MAGGGVASIQRARGDEWAGAAELGLAVSSIGEDGREGPLSPELKVRPGQESAEQVAAPQNLRLEGSRDKRRLVWDADDGG